MKSLSSGLILAHARRFGASSLLSSSVKLQRVFGYILEESLAGRGAAITQKSIGSDALGLGPEFDPGKNPIARVHAGRLRRIITDYPSRPNAEDALVMEMSAGSYELRFRLLMREVAVKPDLAAPVLAMVEFEGIDLGDSWVRLPTLFCEEVGRALESSAGLHWFGLFSRARLEREKLDPVAFGRSYPVKFTVDGSIQQKSGGFILRARLLESATGMQVWCWKSPHPSPASGLSELANDLARWIAEAVGIADRPGLEAVESSTGNEPPPPLY